MDYFGVSHASAGLATTFFFFAYGIGQFLNGFLCKYYNRRIAVSASLLLAAGLNLCVFCGIAFRYIKYLWLLNGLAQSVLWPTLVCVLSDNLQISERKAAVMAMSTTTAAGTLLAYGGSALFSVWNGFRYSFLVGAAATASVGIVWFFCYRSATSEHIVTDAETQRPIQPHVQRADSRVYWMFAILAIFAVVNNLVKDGLTTWVPSILKEQYGFRDSLSILLTLLLPVLGFFGTALATEMGKKIRSFVALSCVLFLCAFVCLGISTAFLNTSIWIVLLISLGLISLFMHGVNNVIISMAPLYSAGQVNSGLVAGVLNGCCYLGSTLSSYGLGLVADNFGWNGAFYVLLALTAVPIIVAFMAALIRRIGGPAKRKN